MLMDGGGMSHKKTTVDAKHEIYFRVESNKEAVLRLFRTYYRSPLATGNMKDDFPDFFLIDPNVLKEAELPRRSSDQIIMEDAGQRASARNGYVGVCKHRNPKLKYYWLELSVFPFMLGDEVTDNNQNEFFYIFSQFIEYTRKNPKIYGDVTAEAATDKDLALMLAEINVRGNQMQEELLHYSMEQLLKFNPNWPVGEVNKLVQALKGSELSWCDVFSEYIVYVMGKQV